MNYFDLKKAGRKAFLADAGDITKYIEKSKMNSNE